MTSNEKRISEIVDKLQSLTLEANVLANELSELRTQGDVKPLHSEKRDDDTKKKQIHDHGFKKGDKVVITNGYRGKKGTTGTVTHTTKTQVTLRDESRKTYIRKYTNVSKTNK
jgi:ATP-dependent exoDNAse (exonuclease V) alpha subunit